MGATALTLAINNRLNEYPDNDRLWVQFVLDHWMSITQAATVHRIDANQEFICRYRPAKFLRSINIPTSLDWVFCRLNNFTTVRDFADRTALLIPSMTQFTALLQGYRTTAQGRVQHLAKLHG